MSYANLEETIDLAERYRIPDVDLRKTNPVGEPPLPSPQPKRQVDVDRIAADTVRAIWIGFLVALSVLIIYLFGPLVGFGIVLVGFAKLKG